MAGFGEPFGGFCGRRRSHSEFGIEFESTSEGEDVMLDRFSI